MSRQTRTLTLLVCFTLLLTGALVSPLHQAEAARNITHMALTRFACGGPSFDFIMSGLFATDDGDGSDLFQVRVVDGAGVLLYEAVGMAAATNYPQRIVVSHTGNEYTPQPTANPIRLEVYEHNGAGMTELLAAGEFSVACLGTEPYIRVELEDAPVTIAVPVILAPESPLMPPPGSPTEPPLNPVDGLPVVAQFTVNMRTVPHVGQPLVTVVAQHTPLTLLGRSRNGQWVLAQDAVGHTGWIITGAQSANLLAIYALPSVE